MHKKNSKKEKMVRKDNKVESSESSPSVSSLVPVAVQMAKRMVTNTRVVEETVEAEFGFPVTEMREEPEEGGEAVEGEGAVVWGGEWGGWVEVSLLVGAR